MTAEFDHTQDPAVTGRAPFVVGEARLQHLFLRYPLRCATVEEYAHAAGMSPDEVLDHLSPLVAAGTLGLDPVEGVFFVHTAPRGRPIPAPAPSPKPNLWETLRERAALPQAYGLWRLIRGLESGGWTVELDQGQLELSNPVPRNLLPLGVIIKSVSVPVVPYPDPHDLPRLLDVFAGAGAHGVAVTCRSRELDNMVTSARSWYLARPGAANLTTFVLEAPSFTATLLRPDDNSVTPVVVQRYDG